MNCPHRRAADGKPAPIDPRLALSPAAQSAHMRGWLAYAMHRPLPPGACADMAAGFAAAALDLDNCVGPA